MKQESKRLHILISLILCVLAILCITNVTYSYFTASTQISNEKNGQVLDKFDDLNVKFGYITKVSSSIQFATTGPVKVFSASGPIQREVEFELSLTKGGTAIQSLSIINESGCDCYVRFWIDAYVVVDGKVNTTTNYGKYFFLDDSVKTMEGEPVLTREGGSIDESWCYFFTETLTRNETNGRGIGNTLILKDVSEQDKVPVDILGGEIQITISLESVQKANQAYLYVFGDAEDERGYYTGWGETEE